MTILHKTIEKYGFFAAAAMNIAGSLVFSRLFTNSAINSADPVVMSNFGLAMIAVWGLAYLGAGMTQGDLKWLAGAFAVEKSVYVFAWSSWMAKNSLSEIYAQDTFAGIFYSIYGLNDFLFMLFFLWVFTRRRHA